MFPYFIHRNITAPLRRSVGSFFIETGMSILNIKDSTVPPVRYDFVGGSDFKATGFEFLRYFIEFGGLRPDHHVLDIGSGIGRMAIPLTNFLKNGQYDGIEIVPRGVHWCQEHITSKFPHFRFHLADIYNKSYNPKGTCRASEYCFPFEDHSFDFIFLTSVFTHMITEDVVNYITQISRVVKKSGRLLSTWFLINGESQTLIGRHPEALQIRFPLAAHPKIYTVNVRNPEDAIGFDETFVRSAFSNNGLKIVEPIRYGSWCRRDDYTSYQDIIVCEKS
ncbi:MAG: class I SAM-dependent methyltransferase [Chitinispirillaceae bacterium]|nr:class I SAM-dependent methyltransferase [Chitinispirillaceae bacterium]